MRKKYTTETTYCGHPIQANDRLRSNCNILDSIKELLDDQLSRHCKVFVTRTDIRKPPQCSADEFKQCIEKTLAATKRTITRRGVDISYLAVKEIGRGNAPHFHLVHFIDGNKIQHPQTLQTEIVKQFNHSLHQCDQPDSSSSVDFCNHSGGNAHMVKRGDQASYDNAFRRVSYMAKENTKPELGRSVYRSQTNKRKSTIKK